MGKKPYYEPINNGNPYWRYNLFTNNCNSFVMNSLYNILPIDDYRRENVKFDQFDPKAQGDNLEQANHLVAEVYKQWVCIV